MYAALRADSWLLVLGKTDTNFTEVQRTSALNNNL